MHLHIANYLSVADNAGDAVLLHVSASSERQECGNKIGLKKTKKHQILKRSHIYVAYFLVVLVHTVSRYTFTLTSYVMS
jgi:hypothetical protein